MTGPVTGATTVPCAHCGEPAVGPSPAYCCAGCRALAGVLEGLEPVPGRYAHYDDPAFRERFVEDGATELEVDGLHCPSCVAVLEQLPRTCPGVRSARLDYGRARLSISWNESQTTLGQIADYVHAIGYATRAVGEDDAPARRSELIRLGVSFALAGNVMMLTAAIYSGADGSFARVFEWAALALSVPVVTYGAWPFYRGALGGLRSRVPHMDLPVSLGLLGGFAASVYATLTGHGEYYYDSLAALVFLLLLGRRLQAGSQRAALGRTELMWSLTPGAATRYEGGAWKRVPATAVLTGDRVRVAAGETLPVDGTALCDGTVDQRLLTGEARPVEIGAGEAVYAGTVCVGGALELVATASGVATRLGGILDLVERADAERAPLVRLADRVAGWFVLSVITLAAVGGLVWWRVEPSRAFDVVVSLLVVSCPCALGLATPIALATARARAARAGILLASTAAVERLARVGTVWFDKTGTLTEGRLRVNGAWISDEHAALAAALEAGSGHPVARAIVEFVLPDGDGTLRPWDVRETPGRGIRGRVAGSVVEVGSPTHLGAPAGAPLDRVLSAGDTPVVVRVDGVPVGLFSLGDELRPDAPGAVRDLQSLGLTVGILSGDHPAVAEAVGKRLGVVARGGLSPEDKAAAARGAAMVGDGFNDAAALRSAEVGMAVRGGAEMALRVADVFLSRGGPGAAAEAVRGARRALSVVRRNLVFSLAYNLLFASLALAGWITPLWAAVLMPASSLTVVGSSVLARTYRAERSEDESPRSDDP